MSAIQTNAEIFNPNDLNLVEVATYRRLVDATLDRVWENVLDWEHLPWLHKTSFDFVELDAGGQWGWRTWSKQDHSSHVELTRATDDSYVARSYQGSHQLSEIWTRLEAHEEKTKVNVSFFITDVAASSVESLGKAMISLYTKLWDEDEAMMQERHQRLYEQRDIETTRVLGREADIRLRLSKGEAITFQLARREFELALSGEQLMVHSTICPHLLGPLSRSDNEQTLSCPWHGYRFDIQSGECIYPKKATCRLTTPPILSLDDGMVIATAPR